ncbi:MAG: N-acetylmuramoyl-L-alanine amidase [Clostridium sp.]|nr:N-acetylmuramoyl-L-alanine amidase [Clostridium sp.]
MFGRNSRSHLASGVTGMALGILLLSATTALPLSARSGQRPFTVVLDPGHGGRDLGASGRRSHEKDITLRIARRTARQLRRRCKGVRVILTRTKDEAMSLEDRAGMANFYGADLLLSIHANSAPTLTQGTETFIHPKAYDGRSKRLALLIQQAYKEEAHREDRGVKTANFAVLRLSRMPAVLTEVGFISHAREEKYIKSRRGCKQLARCLGEAVARWKASQ